MGTILAYLDQGAPQGILALHGQNPLLQIIDLAPAVLGIFSYILGASVDRRILSERAVRDAIADKEQVQRVLAEKLQRQNDDLSELNATLDGLVYTASHDLKTPIINFVSMLKMLRIVKDMPGSEAKVEEIIGRLEGATDRLQITISDLLEVSRVERLGGEAHVPVHLKPLIEELIGSLDTFFQTHGATFEIDLPDDLVLGSASAYVSIFQNLLTNAVKYKSLDRKPVVTMQGRSLGEWLEVRVTDNGSGIDLARQGDKLFKMFTRLQSTMEGSGIGLYIVKRTIDKLGGEIAVESQLGLGTTFILRLPRPQDTTN
jgi:signal transduction histidine kinase